MGPLKGGLQKMLLEQVQKVQQNLVKTQEELANERVEATAGGGMVTAVATGVGEIVEIRIAREAVDPDDVELLQDTVLAAVREAIAKAKQLQGERMQEATGGLSIPGLF
jgi:DNA-binding YbaB/EbfC family protein